MTAQKTAARETRHPSDQSESENNPGDWGQGCPVIDLYPSTLGRGGEGEGGGGGTTKNVTRLNYSFEKFKYSALLVPCRINIVRR